MATNLFKKYSENLVRSVDFGATVQSGQPRLEPVSNRPVVTITATGNATKTSTVPGATVTYDNGGVGNGPESAAAAFDGSWLFPVAGATDGYTVEGAGTAKGTVVYITSGNALTLTASGNTAFGRIDDCNIVSGVAAVEIGV